MVAGLMRLTRVLVGFGLLAALPVRANQMPLSLRQAIELALINNPELRSARLDMEVAKASVEQSKANYDPYLSVNANFSKSEKPSSTPVFGTQSESQSINVSTGANIPTGGNLSVSMQNSRSDSNSSFMELNPSYNVDLGFDFYQPILKGGLMDWRGDNLKMKLNDYTQSEIGLKSKALEIASRVEDAYWTLVRSQLEYEINRRSLERAQAMVKLTEAQVKAGLSPQVSLLQSQANLESVRASLLRGESSLRQAQNNLKQLLYFQTEEELLATTIVPTDQPSVSEYSFDQAQFVDTALVKNYSLDRAYLNLDNMKISNRQTRNQLWPQLDFSGGMDLTGLAGSSSSSTQLSTTGFVIPNPFPTPQPYMLEYTTITTGESDLQGDYFDAVTRLFEGNNLSWNAGLNFRIPLGNRSARSQVRIADYNYQKAELDLSRQRRIIRFSLDSLIADFDSAYKAWQASKLARELADKSYAIEKRKFELGMSTQFQLLDQEQQLKEAEKNEISALIEYNKAIGRIKRAEQGYLESAGLSSFSLPSISMPSLSAGGLGSMAGGMNLGSLSGMLPSGVDLGMLQSLGINLP